MKKYDFKTEEKEERKSQFDTKKYQSKNASSFSTNKPPTINQRYQYMEDQLVWAKIIGYPWWPAIVIRKHFPPYNLNGQGVLQKQLMTYEVAFFGEDSHALIEQSKLAQYSVNRSYFSQYSIKYQRKDYYHKYLEAIKEADQICNEVGENFTIQSNQQVGMEIMVQSSLEDQPPKVQQNKQKRIRKSEKSKSFKKTANRKEKSQMELQKCLALKMLKIMKYKLSNHSTLSLKKAIISILRNKQKSKLQSKDQSIEQYFKLLKSIKQMSASQILKKYMPKSSQIFSSPYKSETTVAEVAEEIQHQNLQYKKNYYELDERGKLHCCNQQQLKQVQISFQF